MKTIKADLKKKINKAIDQLDMEALEDVVGGTFTSNKFTKSQYWRCGISTSYHNLESDEFFFMGRKISYEMANAIAEIADNVLYVLNADYDGSNQISTKEDAFIRAFNCQLKITLGEKWLWNGKAGHDC